MLDAELRDINARLDRHYDALETGHLDLVDLAPRIKSVRDRQSQLEDARVKLESERESNEPAPVDEELVKAYAQDLHELLEESELTERKSFVRSFVERIDVDQELATIHYTLPLPSGSGQSASTEVLPIITFGGA